MRTVYTYLVFVILACFLSCVSCKQENNDLIYSVSDFNIPISCLAPLRGSDSILWICLENGNLIRYNLRTDDKTVVSTKFNDRIYDIIQDTDTTLWLGVRNHGVVKILLKNNSIKTYTAFKIAVPGYELTTNYAPYDIEMDNDGTLFIGTSSGVYRLNKSDSILTTLYRPRAHKKYHFGVSQVKIWNDSIACAMNTGFVILAKDKEYQEKALIINKKISHLYVANDSILYASSDSVRYIIHKNSVLQDSVNIPKGNFFAYVTDTSENKGKWEFTATQINYSNNKSNKSLSFILPARMNSSYRNYLHPGKDFLFFAHGTNLYKLVLHQNTKGKSNHIIAAHTIEDNNICYCISNDNQLYSLPKNGAVSSLGSIGEFESGENIVRICSSGKDSLWFITTKQHLYNINLKPSLFRRLNPFQDTYKVSMDNSLHCDFKSLFFDKEKNEIYVGSRYRLYRMHIPQNKSDKRKIDTLDINKPKDDLYVTDICMSEKGDLFISSLNHGLFKVTGKSLLLQKTREDIGSIHKMISVTGRDILLFSSNGVLDAGIWTKNKPQILTDEKTKSILTLIPALPNKSDPYYAGYHGVGSITLDALVGIKLNDLSHLDVSFNEAAITMGLDNESIILGSQSGLYKYNKDGKLDSIYIPVESISPKTITKIVIVFVLCLIIAGMFVFRIIRNNIRKRVKYMSETIKENQIEISNKVRIENRQTLHDRNNCIKNDCDEIEKNEDKIFKIRNNIAALKKMEIDLNQLRTAIQSKYITGQEIIIANDNIISELKKILGKIEDQVIIYETPNSISSSYELLKKLVLQISNGIISKKNLNEKDKEIENMTQKIQAEYITRQEIIKENNNIIYELKNILGKIEDHVIIYETPNSILSSYELLKEFVLQAYNSIIPIKNLAEENKRDILDLKQKNNDLTQEKTQIENEIVDLVKSIIAAFEICRDMHTKEFLKQFKNKDGSLINSSFNDLKKLIDELNSQFKHCMELPEEIFMSEEMKKDVDSIENLIVDKKHSKEVKEECDRFIKKYASHFHYIADYMKPGEVRAHILILHYQANINPSTIAELDYVEQEQDNRAGNQTIGTDKGTLKDKFKNLFKKYPDLKNNPLIYLLYMRLFKKMVRITVIKDEK
jgi:hypothetical protein